MKKKTILIGLVISAVLILSLVGVVSARAVARYFSGEGTPEPGFGPFGMHGGYGHHGGGYMHEYMVEAVAEAIGLSVNEVNERLVNGESLYEIAESAGLGEEEMAALFDQAHDEALQQAVEDGYLTQEQADLMEEHMEERWEDGFEGMPFGGMHGNGFGGMYGGGFGGMHGGGMYGGGIGAGWMHDYVIDALAEATGLSANEINAGLANGETLYEIAESAGLSEEEFTAVFEQAHDEALQQAVEDGLLTQEQADLMEEHMEGRDLTDMPFGGKYGGGMHGGKGFGGCGGWDDTGTDD